MRLTEAEARVVTARRGQLHGALVELEAALTRPLRDGDEWCKVTTKAVEHLAWTLATHVDETEHPDGLLRSVEAAAPWLAPRIGQLRRDHQILIGRCAALIDRCHGGAPAHDVREDGLDLLSDLTRHRHRGADLLYDADEVDVGVGD